MPTKKQLEERVKVLEQQLSDLNADFEDLHSTGFGGTVIDAGYGTIEYRTNNLVLQGKMDELAQTVSISVCPTLY